VETVFKKFHPVLPVALFSGAWLALVNSIC